MSGFDRTMLRRLRDDTEGTGLVSFVLVIPFFLVVFLAVIEFALAMHQWSLATEAAHVGARLAVVSNPVAVSNLAKPVDTALNRMTYGGKWWLNIGISCSSPAGAANTDGTTALCPALMVRCIGTSSTSGTCTTTTGTGAFQFSSTAFNTIYNQMRGLLPDLQPNQVEISYHANGLGFVGQPYGLPLSITVRVRCRAYNFVVLGGLTGWNTTTNECGANVRGVLIHDALATLTGEDFTTN
jgi:Flp pilus assembly protein TadG